MSGISGFHRPAPKNDLASRVRFPQHQAQASLKKTISTVMDDSVERALYDEILGPLVNRWLLYLLFIYPSLYLSIYLIKLSH